MSNDQLPTTLADAHLEIERLREVCAEAYQVMGTVFLGEDRSWNESDAMRALDNISSAANGDPCPHTDLLPWPRQKGKVKPRQVTIEQWAVIRIEGAGHIESIADDRSNAILRYCWHRVSKESGFDFEQWWKENAKKKHLVCRQVRIKARELVADDARR